MVVGKWTEARGMSQHGSLRKQPSVQPQCRIKYDMEHSWRLSCTGWGGRLHMALYAKQSAEGFTQGPCGAIAKSSTGE